MGFEIPAMTIEYRLEQRSVGRTTLTIRLRGSCPGTTGTIAEYLFGILDFLLPSAQAQRLKECVEGNAQRQALGLTNRGRVKLHQVLAFVPAPRASTAKAS